MQPALNGDGVVGEAGGEFLNTRVVNSGARSQEKQRHNTYLSSLDYPVDHKHA